MPSAKGIHLHKIFKLGKAPAKRDRRNLLFSAVLKRPPPAPPAYDFDLEHPGTPTPMFLNDTYGDCVIAGRAHQTLRFEKLEQRSEIAISDKEVIDEYLKETGGDDTGLIVLDSLKLWRKRGWRAAGARYRIRAFAQIDPRSEDEIRSAVYLDIGVGLGLLLPLTASRQIDAGKPWDVGRGPGSKPGSWGGHYVYVPAYTEVGPVCVTWGRKQPMTWAFLQKYCDEAYVIIDAVNTPKKRRALEEREIARFLAGLESTRSPR